jgi:phenylalanyl-tRNA synthetase beta chain
MPVAKVDVALVVDGAVPAEDVRRALADGGGELVESVRLFDTYSGEQVGAGKVSLAFALRLRAADRTLSSAEVAEVRAAALAEAESRCGAVLRS